MPRTYGYDPVKMSDNMTTEELLALQQSLVDDPKNKNPKGGIWLYTKATHRRLDLIARAIAFQVADRRKTS